MTDNERISKLMGDGFVCQEGGLEYDCTSVGLDCRECDHWGYREYDTFEATWTPELYKAIEDAGLVVPFILNLRDVISDIGGDIYICPDTESFNEVETFFLVQATPAQKTNALARALQEQEKKS